MKTLFITGASTGLGRAAALLFASKGWKVIASMRNPNKAEGFPSDANITFVALDVTQAEAVKNTVAKILEEHSVDAVFANAGYGLAGPFEAYQDEQLVNQFNTNVLGVMRTVQAFLPYFRERGSGQFLVTTSIGGLATFPLNSVYHATKWALEGWAESMDYELRPLGISIKTISPGGILTDFSGRSLDRATSEHYADIQNSVFNRFMDPARRALYSTAEQVAEVVWQAAHDTTHTLRFTAGNDAIQVRKLREEQGADACREYIRQAFVG